MLSPKTNAYSRHESPTDETRPGTVARTTATVAEQIPIMPGIAPRYNRPSPVSFRASLPYRVGAGLVCALIVFSFVASVVRGVRDELARNDAPPNHRSAPLRTGR